MRDALKSVMLELKRELVDNHEACEGTGWLTPVEAGKPNPCDCMVVFHYLNALIEAKIPRDYWWLNIDDLEIATAYKKFCRWFIKRIPHATAHALGVLFLGPNGIGKTSMQCAIGKEAVVQGYRVQYFTAQQYIEAKKNDEELLAEFEDADLILLDEMDKVYIKARSNFVTKTLEDFIRRKTSDGVSFVICTNHDADTLEEVFGQSTMSMLKRHLKFLNVEGDDFGESLQRRWDLLMDTPKDYFAEPIMTLAQSMMSRELEEDELEWKKIDR